MMNQKADLLTTGCWSGRSCFVIGGGPSLRHFDFSSLGDSLTIGVNRAFEFFSPTVLLAIDARFFRMVYESKYGEEAISKLAAYRGIKVGVRMSQAHVPGVLEIKSLGVSGPITPIELGIYHGNNSGYSAVALALALGADLVYMLGIDMRYDGNDTHFHDGHPERTQESELVKKCMPHFITLARSEAGRRVKLINLRWPEESFSRLASHFKEVPFDSDKNTSRTASGKERLQ